MDAKRFGFYLPITKSTQTEDGDWIVEGPLSNPDEDLQGETMDMAGLRKGLTVFERLGQSVDWEHLYQKTKDPQFLIGKGVQIFDAEHPTTGKQVPHLRARLFKGKKIARHAIEHLNEGGTLGYSVEGGAIQKSGSHILETVITMVTLTPQPVVSENTGTIRLLKSLSALENGADWEEVELPVIPQFLSPEAEFQKAMEASGSEPREGPGVNAAEVEDLSNKPATCPTCERPEAECRCNDLRKALAFQIAEELEFLLD